MGTLTKKILERILTERLSLDDPEFFLRKTGGRWVGNIVSTTFRKKRDHVRQNIIWDALEAELGPKSVRLVGMLLAYTPEEWHLGEDDAATTAKVKGKGKGKKAG